MSDEARRIVSVVIDENTGDIDVTVPEYEEGQNVSNATVAVLAFAKKLVTDPEWVMKLVLDYENEVLEEVEGVVAH